MRFRTRPKHRWMRTLVSLCLLMVSALRLLFFDLHNPAPLWLAALQSACCLAFGIVWLLFPLSYCEFEESGLLLRQGWRKSLIPYPSLVELKTIPPPPGEFGRGWILITARDGRRRMISVFDSARFLREAYRRCPGLNPATEAA
jgi:hypothetical protein